MATYGYGVNGESRVHEDTVSDTATYTSDLFPVKIHCASQTLFVVLLGNWSEPT